MKTKKIVGIVIYSVDYLEKDKIITIFSMDGEKIVARARGINSSKAKLKFAGELFSLCEFEISDTPKPILITATSKHMFWGIRESVEKLYLACFLLENLVESVEDVQFLVSSLVFLEREEFSNKLGVKLIFETMKHLGYAFSTTNCAGCGKEIKNVSTFSYDDGGFLCKGCGGGERGGLTSTRKVAEMFDLMSFENLKKMNFKTEQEISVLKLLKSHLEFSLEKKSNNLLQFLNLLV